MSGPAAVVRAAGIATASADPGAVPFPSWGSGAAWMLVAIVAGLLIGAQFAPDGEDEAPRGSR